jgi:hypothetical protein
LVVLVFIVDHIGWLNTSPLDDTLLTLNSALLS